MHGRVHLVVFVGLAVMQLRIHDTDGTDFYLHVTGKAIIENCNRIRVAPCTWTYAETASDFAVR